MDVWKVSDELDIDLAEVEKVVVRVVAGDVTVTAGSSPHLHVRRENGADVSVELNHGTLFISQPESEMAPIERLWKYVTEGRRHRCRVAHHRAAVRADRPHERVRRHRRVRVRRRLEGEVGVGRRDAVGPEARGGREDGVR